MAAKRMLIVSMTESVWLDHVLSDVLMMAIVPAHESALKAAYVPKAMAVETSMIVMRVEPVSMMPVSMDAQRWRARVIRFVTTQPRFVRSQTRAAKMLTAWVPVFVLILNVRQRVRLMLTALVLERVMNWADV